MAEPDLIDEADLAPAPAPRSERRVLAVLVTHEGEPWLDRTLTALSEQTHEALDVVAVDNASTDRSRERLLAHLDERDVLVADIDLGFAGAVSMALDARAGSDADYVLLLHDDIELRPDAVSRLAAALDQDPRLAVVGPKLLDWDDPGRLQALGWTIDLTGRSVPSVDEGELDQGQHDTDGRTLFVSTAGMMVRRDVFDRLGRLDRRYHLFRDDLDVCWRAWLAGHDVEVVPGASALHVASAEQEVRLGRTVALGPRYFHERNTFATLLKNYGFARLLVVVPAYFLVGIAKIFGFLLTRRFADVWQTVRAWLWNGWHLRETARLRRAVQRDRVRSDRELRELFGRITLRVRAYAEAIAGWVAGGDVGPVTPEPLPEVAPEPETATARLMRVLRSRPVPIAAAVLGVVVLVGMMPVLAPGVLRGGELAPWPVSPRIFFGDHGSVWHAVAGLGTDLDPSPSQVLLGLLQLAVFGSSYLAPRVLLLGAPLVGWILALRATQHLSPRRLPRVAAATAYVLSPPAIAALTTGQVSALVVLAVLPGVVGAAATLARPSSSPGRAWRATAGAALLGAVAVAFVPAVLPVLLAGGVVLLVLALPRTPRGWRSLLVVRVVAAAAGPIVLLVPWSLRFTEPDGPLRGLVPGDPVVDPLWRWLLMSPDLGGFVTPVAGIGFVLAGVLGLLIGSRRQPLLVTALWLVGVAGAVAGWWAGRVGSPVWAGLPLLLTAAAFAGLFAVAFARGGAALGRHAFGWRQLGAAVTVTAVFVSLGIVAVDVVLGGERTYVRDQAELPPFLTSTATADDPFRVLLLADVGDEVVFEVVPGAGPTMAATGVESDPAGEEHVAVAVADLVSGRDVAATSALAQLGVRYVVVPDGGTSDRLDGALRGQSGLEPRPVATGRVLAVNGALPWASLVTAADAAALGATGALPAGAEVTRLAVGGGRLSAQLTSDLEEPGVLLLAELPSARWHATTADGVPLTRIEDAPVVAFEVPAGRTVIELGHAGQAGRQIALAGQLLAVLLAISLMLRPPGLARPAGTPVAAPGPARADGEGAS